MKNRFSELKLMNIHPVPECERFIHVDIDNLNFSLKDWFKSEFDKLDKDISLSHRVLFTLRELYPNVLYYDKNYLQVLFFERKNDWNWFINIMISDEYLKEEYLEIGTIENKDVKHYDIY